MSARALPPSAAQKSSAEKSIAMPQDDPFNATLIRRDDFNEYTSLFYIKPDEGLVPEFEPGQFTTIGLPDPKAEPKVGKDGKPKLRWIRRAYSIASSSAVREYFELFIILVEDGQLTPHLWKLPVGSGRIWLSPKISGDFTLRPVPDGKDLVLISTGTGIAPYISMVRRYWGQQRWNRCTLVNGCRLAKDLCYVEECRAWERQDPNFRYLPMVTREPEDSDYKGLRGRCTQVIDPAFYRQHVGADLTPEQCHVFLCGNPQMIDQCEEQLIAMGFKTHKKNDPGNIHLERYW